MARTGRPGPVLVDIPKDVLNASLEFEYPETVDIPGYHPPVREEPRLKDAAQLIRSSTRPVIYLGGGVRTAEAHREVFAFAEFLGAPVVTTVHGKGAFPETHPLCLGMFGMHGSRYANYAVQDSDLLIALGARFDDRVTGKLSTFAPEAKVVHLDIDPAEISKLVTATVPLVGDMKVLLPRLHEEVRQAFAGARPAGHLRLEEEGGRLAREAPAALQAGGPTGRFSRSTSSRPSGRRPAARRWSPPAWASTRCSPPSGGRPAEPRHFITSGGLGTMGFCLPSAIGIQLARPDALVIGIDGDGSFQMTLQDLATASEHKLPVQDLHPQQPVPGHGAAVAGAVLHGALRGDPAGRSARPGEAGRGLRLPRACGRGRWPSWTRSSTRPWPTTRGRPSWTCASAAEAKVYPMVPAGAPLNDMIDGE